MHSPTRLRTSPDWLQEELLNSTLLSVMQTDCSRSRLELGDASFSSLLQQNRNPGVLVGVPPELQWLRGGGCGQGDPDKRSSSTIPALGRCRLLEQKRSPMHRKRRGLDRTWPAQEQPVVSARQGLVQVWLSVCRSKEPRGFQALCQARAHAQCTVLWVPGNRKAQPFRGDLVMAPLTGWGRGWYGLTTMAKTWPPPTTRWRPSTSAPLNLTCWPSCP